MDKRGKVFVSVIALFILLISISSYFVLATETNTKTYDASTKTVTIKNGVTEVADIKLNTPLVYSVIRGKDRLVAEFTIDSHIDYSNVFNDMEFYDVKNNMNEFSRTFNYKYKTYYDIEVPDYEISCKERLSSNGTLEKYDCVQNQIGTHIEQRVRWNNFNKDSILPAGSITLGIFTDVLPNERVEWIPTLYGIRINEWAGWTENLSNGLVSYYGFNEGGGIRTYDIIKKYNATLLTDLWGDGINYTSKDLNGETFNTSVNMASLKTTNETTINFWMRTNATLSTDKYIIDGSISTSLDGFIIHNHGNSIWMGFIAPNWDYISTSTPNINTNEWTMITFTINSTGFASQYHNGTFVAGKCSAGVCPRDSGVMFSDTNIEIGQSNDVSFKIDEFAVWNRTLTPSEVSYLYDNGAGTFYTPSSQDNPPEIILNVPINYYNSSSDSVTFNCSATDDYKIQNISLWINGERNYTFQDGADNFTSLEILRSLADGIYNWSCSAEDNATQTVISSNRTLTVDTTPPSTTQPVITPENPETSDDLKCYATLTDNIQTSLTAYWKWYKNDVSYLSGNSSITNGTYSLITTLDSGNTTTGDNWTCEILPFDGNYGNAVNSSAIEIGWAITFNVTDSYYGTGLNNVLISCNQTGFSQEGDTTNPYGPYGFAPGSYTCEFERSVSHFNKTITFIAESDQTINVSMAESGFLSEEEHTWLEWLYNCWHSGDCWNLLANINQTTTQTWQRLTGTDWSVILQENITSYYLSPSTNIEIDYTIKIPYKEGVPINELLPIRLYFWFTNVSRTGCYNQNKIAKDNIAEYPYCLPLMAETLGPNNGTKTFKVSLKPELATGTYNITRSVEIDPLGVWTQYGREDIGQIEVLESGDASLEISNENNINFEASSPSNSASSSSSSGGNSGTTKVYKNYNNYYITEDNKDEESQKSGEDMIYLNKPRITGEAIGSLLSEGSLVFIVVILCGTFIIFIAIRYKTVLKLKKKS